MRVLLVEDDARMAAALTRSLGVEGVATEVTGRGGEALEIARRREFDAVVLDVMLPDLDGFETCRRLRAEGVWTPIIMLTARDAVEDRIRGLDEGADDYLTKPFSLAELLARLRAQARRAPVKRPAVLEVGDLRLDPATRRASRGDTEVQLSAREFTLLETFMRRPGATLSQASSSRPPGTRGSSLARTWSRSTCATSERRSTARSRSSRSRRCAEWATGCALTDP